MERLYFIRELDDGPVKIGVSANPVERMRVMQTGNPRPLELVAWLDVPRGVERGLHDLFHSRRVSGEWFEPDELLEHVLIHAVAIMERGAEDSS